MPSDSCPVCNLYLDMDPQFEDLEPRVCNLCSALVHPGCLESEYGEWCLNCEEKGEG